ncbi:MAG: hypothetical protein M3O26_12050 [Pseudomonadota bacterium]|nr:hypothetical protein [Pseudomonadota bacterium]
MNLLINEIPGRLKSRRFKEIAAITLCLVSAVGGWYDLKRGAQFGDEVCTISLIWIFAYSWLTGRWWPSKAERNMTIQDIYNAAKADRLPKNSDSPLERTISSGSTAFGLMLLYWIFSGAWLI